MKSSDELEQRLREAAPPPDEAFADALEARLIAKLAAKDSKMALSNVRPTTPFFKPRLLLWLAASVALLLIALAGFFVFNRDGEPVITTALQTQPEATASFTPSPTHTHAPTFVPTATPIQPTATSLPTVIPPATLSSPAKLSFDAAVAQFLGLADATFLLYDQAADILTVHNLDHALTPYTPYSTFKIFNAAVALENGTLPDAETAITYDPTQYPLNNLPAGLPFDEWPRDHTLRSGMQYSVVWFYTEVARQTGQATMQDYIDRANYGNGNLGDYLDGTLFWLGGGLEITPIQQMQFLVDFYNETSVFSPETTRAVKDILILEETAAYRFAGKTGSGPLYGWFVGWVQTLDSVYFYVLHTDELDDREATVRNILTSQGILPPQ